MEMLLLRDASNYFRKFVDFLVHKYGYEKDKNLVAYSYDWRQDVSHDVI